MVKIFISHNTEDLEVYFRQSHDALSELGELVLNPNARDLETDELIEAAQDCDIVICHRSTHGKTAVFENLPNLVAFLRPAVDVSDIDLAAASANGIVVANSIPSFIAATAEMALGMMIDLARDISTSTTGFKSGEMPPSNMGRQLKDSTVGIFGYGRITQHLVNILVVMGMRVLICDPYVTVDRDDIEQVDAETLLRESHFVLPLAQATKETENLINADTIALMRPDVHFINVSRGNLVDEVALEAAYKEGRITKMAMDVGRAPDQRPSPHIAAMPGVVATPHLGGLTQQAVNAQSWSTVDQVKAILAGDMPPRALNPDDATRLAAFANRTS